MSPFKMPEGHNWHAQAMRRHRFERFGFKVGVAAGRAVDDALERLRLLREEAPSFARDVAAAAVFSAEVWLELQKMPVRFSPGVVAGAARRLFRENGLAAHVCLRREWRA